MDEKIHFYCINLKERTDRWEAFSKQHAVKDIEKNFKFERFEAVVGSTVDVQNDSRISLRTKRNIKESSRRDHEDLNTAGGIGCYLSHTDIWRKIADAPEPFAVIFEDDTRLPDDFIQKFKKAFRDINLLPKMPEIWTFSYGWDFYYRLRGKPLPQNLPEGVRGSWISNTCPGGTNGYFITKDGAKKLLENAFPIDMHVDLYICLCTELKRINCVSHKDVIVGPLTEVERSDIQLPETCEICEIPSNFTEEGYVFVNVRLIIIGIVCVYGLYYLYNNVFLKKRRKMF